MKRFLLLIVCLVLASCASHDFMVTSFMKSKSDEIYDYYIYKSFADTIYKVDSDEAEKIRMDWLKRWLNENKLNESAYEVTRRDVVNKNGNIKDIYYELRIKK